jgi:hypothetical protein
MFDLLTSLVRSFIECEIDLGLKYNKLNKTATLEEIKVEPFSTTEKS